MSLCDFHDEIRSGVEKCTYSVLNTVPNICCNAVCMLQADESVSVRSAAVHVLPCIYVCLEKSEMLDLIDFMM